MSLKQKIENRSLTVGVVGLGYVGLPLILAYAEKNVKCLGFDIDQSKVDQIHAGKSYFKHISSDRIAKQVRENRFSATVDFSRISEVDVVLICVPTPLTRYREPDTSFISMTAENIYPHLRAEQLVVLESSTYPGTTEELLKPILEQSGLKANVDFYLAFSPEREDPNNPNYSTETIPKVVGANTPTAQELTKLFYEIAITKVVPVSTSQVAEATKLLENIFRSVNIALVNEMKMILDKMDIDVWEVINAAATKPFGFMPFYPGPGLGGHCIPIDPFYLTWKAKEYGVSTKFIELAGEINTHMPEWVIQKCSDALNTHKKALNGSNVLVVGLSYKKNIDDLRESPSLRLIELLKQKGAEVSYHDAYFPEIPNTRKYQFEKTSVELTETNLAQFDLVLISTNHDDVDYKFLQKNSKLIVDTRHSFSEEFENVVRA